MFRLLLDDDSRLWHFLKQGRLLLLLDVDVPGLDNPVPLAVRDIVVEPQNAVGIDPAVRSDNRSVVEPIFLPDLTAPGLILEEPSIAVIGLDVELGWRELGCRLTEDFCKACGKKEQDGRPTTTLQC